MGWGLAGAGSSDAGLGGHANGDGWPNLGNLLKIEGCPDQGGMSNIDECPGVTRELNVNTDLHVTLASVVVWAWIWVSICCLMSSSSSLVAFLSMVCWEGLFMELSLWLC